MTTTPSAYNDKFEGMTGPEMVKEISDNHANSLDEVLNRDPTAKPIADEEIMRQILNLRADRARIEVKIEKHKAKKQGIEEPKDDSE